MAVRGVPGGRESGEGGRGLFAHQSSALRAAPRKPQEHAADDDSEAVSGAGRGYYLSCRVGGTGRVLPSHVVLQPHPSPGNLGHRLRARSQKPWVLILVPSGAVSLCASVSHISQMGARAALGSFPRDHREGECMERKEKKRKLLFKDQRAAGSSRRDRGSAWPLDPLWGYCLTLLSVGDLAAGP